jgi:hypothetical protein
MKKLKIRSTKYATATVTFAIFVDSFAYSLAIPFLNEIVQKKGGKEFMTGIIFACFSVGLIIGL